VAQGTVDEIFATIQVQDFFKQVLWTWKEVRATVVTAGHCIHGELSSGQAGFG